MAVGAGISRGGWGCKCTQVGKTLPDNDIHDEHVPHQSNDTHDGVKSGDDDGNDHRDGALVSSFGVRDGGVGAEVAAERAAVGHRLGGMLARHLRRVAHVVHDVPSGSVKRFDLPESGAVSDLLQGPQDTQTAPPPGTLTLR